MHIAWHMNGIRAPYRIVHETKWQIKRSLYKFYRETWNHFIRSCRFYKSAHLLYYYFRIRVECHRKNVRHRRSSCVSPSAYVCGCIRLFNLFLIHAAVCSIVLPFGITWYIIPHNRCEPQLIQIVLTVWPNVAAKFRCLEFHLDKISTLGKKRNHLFKHRTFVCSQAVWAKRVKERV